MSILDAEKTTLTAEEQLAILKAENERLKAKLESKSTKGEGIPITVFDPKGNGKEFVMSLRVSEKGAISVYGTGRFPMTAYPLHMLALLGVGDQIKAFIEANADKLSWAKAKE